MSAYSRFFAADLPKAVGLDAEGGRRRSDGREGHLCHGPYITLGPGRYTAGFYVRRAPGDEEGEIEIEACSQHGRRVFARRSAAVRDMFCSVDGLFHVDFAIDGVERGCELRLRVPPRCQVEVTEAVIFRSDLAPWGVR